MAVATRGVEREIGSLQMEEKKLVAEIKKTAKAGNEAATKILARQLVRLRQQIINLQGTRAQIRGVATHTQAMYAGTSISAGMKGASKAMAAMNKQMEAAKQMKVMREFQKQSTQLDMTLEMMSGAIDETLDKDEAKRKQKSLQTRFLMRLVSMWLLSCLQLLKVVLERATRKSRITKHVDLERRLASLRRI